MVYLKDGVICQILPPFDLKVGDQVIIKEDLGYTEQKIFNVTAIYKHIFLTRSQCGVFSMCFQKKEYQLGNVKRYFETGDKTIIEEKPNPKVMSL